MTALLLALLLAVPSDTARVEAHLQQVEQELRSNPDPTLSPQQAANRARLLDALHDYWMAGSFPRNLELPHRNPIFVDPWGIRCAMAHLIEVGGGGALVARIAATRNTAYIRELAADPDLRAWLTEHGLTLAEAARIQPAYDPAPTGWLCWTGSTCAAGRCLVVDPQLGYCTEECDLAADTCPVGAREVQMVCTAPEGEGAATCRYPGPVPGGLGWPCADDPYACWHTCVGEGQAATCTYSCLPDADHCPATHECVPHDDDTHVCVERSGDGGCAASASRAAGTAIPLLLIPFLLRPRRGSRRAARRRYFRR